MPDRVLELAHQAQKLGKRDRVDLPAVADDLVMAAAVVTIVHFDFETSTDEIPSPRFEELGIRNESQAVESARQAVWQLAHWINQDWINQDESPS